MLRRVPNALLAAALMTMPLAAQRGGGMPVRFPSTPGIRSFHPPSGQPGHPRGGTVFLGTPLWAGDFAPSNSVTPSAIVVQAAPAEKPADREEPRPAAPLLIEWQGDRYVRRAEPSSATAQRDYVAEAKPAASASPHGTPALAHIELPPTVFVFRDGHREESSDYFIITGVIYARGQYWTNGYWSKQISLSQLDLPATFKANQERGAPFRLPGAPYEIITRP